MVVLSCTFVGICLFLLGSSGNGLCILVFLRKKFRYRMITPYFIVLLLADSTYLLFRLMKLPYYSQTLFKFRTNTKGSCITTFLVQAYEHATQTWPQPFIPLVQSETYMRFSLILMCIMSIQRTVFLTRSLKLLIVRTTFTEKYKYQGTILIIISAFLLAYSFEFAGLTLFCSKSSNQNMIYDWFIHMNKYMKNVTYLLTNTMTDQTDALKCVNYTINRLQTNQTLFLEKNSVCKKTELMNILSYYFDQHQKPIVNLIQKIIFSKTGDTMTRNEIRRKYHFHECLFPQEPNFFDRYYNFMYSRLFSFNRYTLLLIFGSIIPSLITILSNMISLYSVQKLNRLTSVYILPCRRRTDDTRRILLVITVECFFAILNTWFGDIILSLIFCKRKLSAGDDCPSYLSKIYDLLVMFDLINSLSNIILHCLCGRSFRNELRLMLLGWFYRVKRLFRDIWCCYFQIDCTKLRKEPYVTYKVAATRDEISKSLDNEYVHFNIQPAPEQHKNCCNCRWYCQRKRLSINQEFTQKDQITRDRRYMSLTQQTGSTRQTQPNAMRLYYPSQ
ncbi:unnamed protein product [Adineta steineri]|uniref:G-protein coupled receptors family 1 profile domain-containing protein n=1 Tax=Adineta steineri TaxID=433720 RepID=A0A818HH56_9BILA|nr:unnamed protein product [Adineta steineri]